MTDGFASHKMLVALISLSLWAGGAHAQIRPDAKLEAQLRSSDARALMMFPALGFTDGVAGFFRRHGLYVIPESEQAWCQDESKGRLKAGCYAVVAIQVKGGKAKTADGVWCGSLARWYKAPGSHSYVPVPGWAMMALPIAEGNAAFVLSSIRNDTRRLCE
jgi:hypothetical protein